VAICDIPVISNVCDVAGEAAATLVSAPFYWLAQAMGQAAGWLFEAVWSVFDTTTLVDLSDPGYIGVYNVLFGVAVDRKSTRLNSSHVSISYADFCLNKKLKYVFV